MITAYMNWSGGKDSAICLYKILQSKQYQVKSLLTSINSAYNRLSIHWVRRSLLIAQAEAIGIPLQAIELPEQTDMEEYEKKMFRTVSALKHAGCTYSIFGDIFLEDLRIYRENKLCEIDISCVFPGVVEQSEENSNLRMDDLEAIVRFALHRR